MALLQLGVMPRALMSKLTTSATVATAAAAAAASSSLPSTSSFICRQCLRHQQKKVAPLRIAVQMMSRYTTASSSSPPSPRRFASTTTATPASTASKTIKLATTAGPFGAGSKAFSSKAPDLSASGATTAAAGGKTDGASGDTGSSSSFPDTSSKAVAYWLIASAASVFGIVVFGGLTRLTESGLSITEWRPVTGSVPPRSAEDWESEFAKYRASPEYALLNPNMDLDEFKKIYFMEWTHRLWGRFIGLSFVGPAIYFVARRRVTRPMAWNLLGISSLIGFQGFIGWWMVSSGLTDDLFAPGSHPRVSQYRLTAHLATAFVLYGWMVLSGVSVLRTHRLLATPSAAEAKAATMKLVEQLSHPHLRPFRRASWALAALAFTTAMSGALVAGLDAGLIYNEFPMMGNGLAPPWSELFDKFYSRKPDNSDLWWRNLLENPSLVQLDHRILATTTFCAVLALFAWARYSRTIAAVLPRNARRGVTGVVHLTLLQVTLGFFTLIWMVPTHLAATHQAGALALLTGTLVLCHRLHVPRSAVKVLERRLLKAGGGGGGGGASASSLTGGKKL